ncbi:MAG TPA: choice-of-anchor Q domain-containing protein [Chthoniobacterales bacterium]|jgi:CSLREA domain-containing protein
MTQKLFCVLLLAAFSLPAAISREFSTPHAPGAGLAYSVDSTGDGALVGSVNFCDDGTGHCTLRAAIQAANGHAGTDGIFFDLPPGAVINLTQALPDMTQSVSIVGPGPNLLTVRRSTSANYRIFNVASGTVSISGITITNGSAITRGGGINNSGGTVNVTNCIFLNNVAHDGGAMNTDGGTLNITNCTFRGNDVIGNGGGIAINFSGHVNVMNSTFGGNIAGDGDPNADGGGAICNGSSNFAGSGILKVTNSTFVANSAFTGGAISTLMAGEVYVTNSTFSGNFVGFSNQGGAIASDSTGPVNVKSSILAGSTGGVNFPNRSDVSGIFNSAGYNLVSKSDNSTGFTQATDEVGTIASPLDPKLDPAGLQNNGGPTQTIALQPGSPALDKGTSSGLNGNLTTDQRGSPFSRTTNYTNIAEASGGDGTDIGAFEGTALKITAITRLTNGHILLHGIGVPGAPHTIEHSPDPGSNTFTAFPTATAADGTGALQYDDDTAVGLAKQFYRLRFP